MPRSVGSNPTGTIQVRGPAPVPDGCEARAANSGGSVRLRPGALGSVSKWLKDAGRNPATLEGEHRRFESCPAHCQFASVRERVTI